MSPSAVHTVRPAPSVAVVGASGGIGASTLAVAVARRLAAGGAGAVVVDLDLGSGGLDVTAGVEHLDGRRWAAFAELRGTVPEGPLVASLPGEDRCHVLAAGGPGPPEVPAAAVLDVLDSLLGGTVDVVLDVPRGSPLLGEVLTRVGLVVVLGGLRTRQLADADRCVERVVDLVAEDGSGPDLRLVTRGPAPPAAVLDDVEAHLGIAHLAHLPDDPAVPRDAERGLWPATSRDAVRRAAETVAEAVRSGARPGHEHGLGRAS